MSLGENVKRDLRRGAAAAMVGAASVAVLELVLSIVVARTRVGPVTMLRFAALDVTLIGLAAVLLVPVSAVLHAFVRRLAGAGTAAAPGRVPLCWALVFCAGLYVSASFGLTLVFRRFREPVLAALALAGVQLVLFALLAGVAVVLTAGLRRAAARIEPRLRGLNLLGRPLPALVVLAVAVIAGGTVLVWRVPMLRAVIPGRELVSAAVYGVGFVLGLRLVDRRGQLWPTDGLRRRVTLASAVASFCVLGSLTLWKIGADDETRYLALTASPTLSHIVDAVRRANDFDGDGYATLLGENDCGPFDPKINPAARDIPDNGIDENCNGYDFTAKGVTDPRGQRMAVPPQYRQSWNILLVTVDALRYDHTGMGGYLQTRKRDTTPRLDALARRGVWFTFANAPSAGTMASVPSLLTSKFFHSGVAQKTPPGFIAPILLPENVTIPDVVKRAGYFTGAIVTHDYFGPKGMQLAGEFDAFDNELGAKREPSRITSQEITDRAQAWISSRTAKQPWFLWLHYLDPHGFYMPHPGDVEFGTSEEDRYDGEIAYTDKHLGRLLDFLMRSPHGKRTVIIVTADHGEGFNEHGYINHGMTLYKELLHVPLLVYVPDIEPHSVDGPVSVLDVLPTIADLAGVEIADVPVQGESLVPELFYARDARQRVVFAETNYPDPMRAAIADDYKLIYNLKANVYQLFDLRRDAWEKVNVWGKDAAGRAKMKRVLDDWLDRVFFNREVGNEAQELRAKIILPGAPSPQNVVQAGFGAIELSGWDATTKEVKPGQLLEVAIYLRASAASPVNYRFEVEAQSGTTPPMRTEVIPANGLYPTSRWRPGEYIKLTFSFKVPPTWQAGTVALHLRVLDDRRTAIPATGPAAADGNGALLGSIPLVLATHP